MKIALCTELRNAEWFESRLRPLCWGTDSRSSTSYGMRSSYSGTAAEPLLCGCHRHDRARGTGGCHSGKAAGTGNTACLVER